MNKVKELISIHGMICIEEDTQNMIKTSFVDLLCRYSFEQNETG